MVTLVKKQSIKMLSLESANGELFQATGVFKL